MATGAAPRRAARPTARKGASGPATARRRTADRSELGSRALAFVLVAVGVAILVALGVWQLQRLHWKQNLLARIAALQDAPAEPLNVVLNRVHDGGEVDFVRVQTLCPTLEATPTLRLYALTDGPAGGVSGYRLITVCPIADAAGYRSILVDRGFVAREAADRVPTTASPVDTPITGVLRVPDKPSWLTPKHTSAGADWYGRDVPAMASDLHAAAPAPLFLMLESPRPRGFGPTPAPVPVDIPNRHFEYALTWFGLAAALVGVYIASLFARRSVGRR